MRRTVLLVALASLLALGGQSFAELCTIDAVPAATLLLPYFEVELVGDGETPTVDTLFSVNNASAAPTVAHVTLWGDWSLPSIDFDIFLTGYDVQTVSLSSVFNGGNLPITAHAWNDPTDSISPHGSNPAWDSQPDNPANPRFPGCDINLPIGGGNNPVLSAALLDRIRNGHTGVPSAGNYGGGCIGEDMGDGIARGYITIDNVNDCNLLFPNQDGYFGTGLVSFVNQLWGDWFIINRDEGFAFGENLVHIEADEQAFAPGDYTYYGRYVSGLALDGREPLATTWGSRYLQPNALFDSGTDLLVWRDSKCDNNFAGFTCGVTPGFGPLNETQVVAFDEQECALQICLPENQPPGGISPPPDPDEDPTCFPLCTGRYGIGEGELSPVFDFGWIYLNLNHTLNSGGFCATDGLFGDIAQSWVVSNLDSSTFNLSVGFAAIQLSSACSDANPVIVGDLDGGPCPWSDPAE